MTPRRGQRKPPHYRGSYDADAKRVRDAANADPYTRCWRCGRTLGEHPPTRTGKPAAWTAGHVRDGEVGGELRPEADVCNASRGGSQSTSAGRWPPG